jgi:16S rRNA processing protein RimM
LSRIHLEDLLEIGRVIRPHGLAGLLRIQSYAQSEGSFLDAGTVYLHTRSGDIHEYPVESVRPQKSVHLMNLVGLDSLDAAEEYRDAKILIRRNALRREQEDEFFWYELIGLSVYLRSGEYIGTIEEVLPTGSHDIYVAREGKQEILIPAVHEVVEEIDIDNRKMIISEVKGLLDLNEV